MKKLKLVSLTNTLDDTLLKKTSKGEIMTTNSVEINQNVPYRKFENNWYRPEWMQLRTKIFERDHYECQRCGVKNKAIIGHHIVYIKGREIWEYPEAYLLTLCTDCHEKHHKAHGKITYNDEESANKELAHHRSILLPLGEPEKKEANETNIDSSLAPGQSVVSVSVTTSATPLPKKTVRHPRRKHNWTVGKRSRRKGTVSCTTRVTKDFSDIVWNLSEKTGLLMTEILRPFVHLINFYRIEIGECKSEGEIITLVHNKMK